MQKISHSRRRFLAGAAVCAAAPAVSLSANDSAAAVELVAGVSSHPLGGSDSPPVSLWTFNGATPGPLLRGRRGDSLGVRLLNRMEGASTSVHWHGVRVENKMDGVAGVTQSAVSPGDDFDYEVALPDAGTFWYHSHDQSWEQVARGLYGPLVVDDPDDPPVDRDLVLMVDDWKLSRDGGGLDEASFGHLGEWSHGGRLGNWLTVNSVSQPVYDVPAGGRVRLRLVNPANARIFRLSLPSEMEARVVALDGMPVAPRDFPSDGFTLAPAQRADVVSDLPRLAGASYLLRALFGRGESMTAATLRTVAAGGKLAEKVAWPSPPGLSWPSREGAAHAVVRMMGGAMGGMRGAMMGGKMRSMRELAGHRKLWAFNDRVGGLDFELLRLRPGQTGILRVENDTAWPHAMHLHGHHFIPSPVGAAEKGGELVLRDTHLLERREVSEYVFTAGKPGKWLFHCHMLEHHAAGMAGIVVVA